MERAILFGAPKDKAQFNGSVVHVLSKSDSRAQVVTAQGQVLIWKSACLLPVFPLKKIPKPKPSGSEGQPSEEDKDDDRKSLEDFFEVAEGRAQELLDQLFPSSRKRLGYIPGGSFNSLIDVTVDRRHHFILRMPKKKLTRARFQDITAIYKMLVQQPMLVGRVPKLILFSEKENNALGRQFWLQSHLGSPLSRVWEETDRSHLAVLVANFLADMFDVTFPACGPLVAGSSGQAVIGRPVLLRRDHPQKYDIGCGTVLHAVYDPDSLPPVDIDSWFQTRFRAMALCRGDLVCEAFRKLARKLLRAQQQTVEQRNCLVHTDFYRRNLIYHEGQLRVVDWDDCEVLPAELAYFLPDWLWHEDEDNDGILSLSRRLSLCHGADPDEKLDEASDKIRTAFFNAIERRIPGYVGVVRQTRNSGLVILGKVASYGTTARMPGTAFFTEAIKLLRKHGYDDQSVSALFHKKIPD